MNRVLHIDVTDRDACVDDANRFHVLNDGMNNDECDVGTYGVDTKIECVQRPGRAVRGEPELQRLGRAGLLESEEQKTKVDSVVGVLGDPGHVRSIVCMVVGGLVDVVGPQSRCNFSC